MKVSRLVEKIILFEVALAISASLGALITLIYSASRRTAPEYKTAPFSRGSFDPDTGQILCSDPDTCNHELGHWYDASLGHPSCYPQWQNTICTSFAQAERSNHPTDFDQYILSFPGICGNKMLVVPGYAPWGGYQELYASIYDRADGNIGLIDPKIQKFFQPAKGGDPEQQ